MGNIFTQENVEEKFEIILRNHRVAFESKWNSHEKGAYSKCDDFIYIRRLGEGGFGKVLLGKCKRTKKFFAIKLMLKRDLVDKRQVKQAFNERKILFCNDFRFLMSLHSFAKDYSTVYLVMEFMDGGELYAYLKRMKRFSEPLARFYAAQVILGIKYLHTMDLTYRDMKPENLLLDIRGYLKIGDFGFAKKVKSKTWTFCGTPDYMAPEVILSLGMNQAVDWWGIGILIFEMCAGFAPFADPQEDNVYAKILAGQYKIPYHFSQQVEDLIEQFLRANPSTRLGMGANDTQKIRSHPWFTNLDWTLIYEKKIISDLVPDCPTRLQLESKKQADIQKHLGPVASSEEFPDLFADF